MQNINYKELEDVYMPSNFDEVVDSCHLKTSRKVILKEIIKYSQYNSLHGCFFSEREEKRIFMITYVNWDKFEGEPKFKL